MSIAFFIISFTRTKSYTIMKYYLQLLFVFILIKNMNAQVSFVNGAESVEYDAVNNKYIASSPSDKKIYNVVKGGTPTTLVSPVSAPYGMECIGNNDKESISNRD